MKREILDHYDFSERSNLITGGDLIQEYRQGYLSIEDPLLYWTKWGDPFVYDGSLHRLYGSSMYKVIEKNVMNLDQLKAQRSRFIKILND